MEPLPDGSHLEGIDAHHESLRAEAEADRFFRLSPDMFAIASAATGMWLRVNPAMTDILGWSGHEFLTTPFFALVHPDDVQRSMDATANPAAGQNLAHFEHRVLCKDTSYKWVEWQTTAIPSQQLMYCFGRDITARKRTEDALREYEEGFRLFVIAASEIVYRMSADWREMRSLEGKGFLADTRNPNVTWLEGYIPDSDKAFVQAAIADAIRTKTPFELEHRVIRADGGIGWVFSRAFPSVDARGDIVEWFGTASDITERKRTEANLAFLADVSQHLAHLTKIDETMNALGERLAAYFDLSACAFAELVDNAQIGVINYGWHRADMPSLLGTYRMEAFVAPEVLRRCRAGEAVVIRDVFADPLVDGAQYAALNIGSFVSMPLVRGSEWCFLLVVYRSDAYNWRDDEIDMLRELTTRIWTRLERARVEEALQQAYAVLEQRVMERTAALVEANDERTVLLQRIITAQEDERQRISRELHDGLGQWLTALMVHLALLDAKAEPLPEVRARLGDVQTVARNMDSELDRLTMELRPPGLTDLGLREALDHYTEEWMTRSDIPLDLLIQGLDGERLPTSIETNVYRIVQEALTNVLKYAQATQVSIILTLETDQLRVILEDDGVGFDVDAVRREQRGGRQVGLIGMRERATLIGGTLTIDSEPGSGTTIYLTIPLANEDPSPEIPNAN